MKTLINIISLIVLTTSLAQGQTTDSIIQKLVNNNLIEQSQIKASEELLNTGYPKSKSHYIYILFQLSFKKLTGHDYGPFTSFDFGGTKPKPSKQLKINEELTSYLSSLKSCDLVNQKQFETFKTQINNNNFVHKLQFQLAVIAFIEEQEHMAPKKLKVFADILKEQDIVNSQYQQLLSDIEQEKLENPIDFLNYCNKAVIIKEQDFPDKPEDYLELIHRKTASIIPELNFTNFEFKIVLDSTNSYDEDSKFYDFVVSVSLNGKTYKQKSSYHLYSPSKNQYYGNKIDKQTYYQLFNKILADIQSPYRLHSVERTRNNAVDWTTFGIIALTKEQARRLHSGGVYFTPSYENFKQNVTSAKIKEAIEAYQEIGLLTHLSSAQIEQAKAKAAEQVNYSINNILEVFPDVIYNFDTELGNLEDPYAELIREYKRISHQDFNASNISDNFDIDKNRTAVLKFELGTNTYSKTLQIEDDWIDMTVFDFIKTVATENNLKGQFYQLYTGGQDVSVIYLSQEQYEYLKAHQFLSFGDDMKAYEDEY